MQVGNHFVFYGGPLGLNWDIQGKTIMQQLLAVQGVIFTDNFGPAILNLKRDKKDALLRARNKMREIADPEKLKKWEEEGFYTNLVILLRRLYFAWDDEEIKDEVYKAISLQLAKGLLETKDLELVYVKSEPYEPDDLSIMCEYGKSEMFDRTKWLLNGNKLGQILMDIRKELKEKRKNGII
jgi:hypothetical protein